MTTFMDQLLWPGPAAGEATPPCCSRNISGIISSSISSITITIIIISISISIIIISAAAAERPASPTPRRIGFVAGPGWWWWW